MGSLPPGTSRRFLFGASRLALGTPAPADDHRSVDAYTLVQERRCHDSLEVPASGGATVHGGVSGRGEGEDGQALGVTGTSRTMFVAEPSDPFFLEVPGAKRP